MAQRINSKHYDVVVIGGGSAGIAAAVSAARNGASTLLLESGPMVGGDLVSGLPVDGCLSSRGEWIVGGVAKELFDECRRYDGYIGPVNDYRSLYVVAVDPEVMKFAVVKLLHRYNVSVLLYTFAEDAVVEDGVIRGIAAVNKSGRMLITADVFIDCGGDGDIAVLAGAPYEFGGPRGELQPVSMVFRMCNVDAERLLRFVRDHPENFGLGENPMIGLTKEQCAEALYRQGLPKAFMVAEGPLLGRAIAEGEMYRTSMLGITPISLARKEVSINSTRMSGISGIHTEQLSRSLPALLEQMEVCIRFLKNRVPGFQDAVFSGIAPRIGVRETRRIMGDSILQTEDVLEGRKRPDGIGKGGHELDIHGSGTGHVRGIIKDAGSYDIPYGCLIPQRLENTLIAGRCLSATREAHSSARVMGTCMVMGQAAGTAAALSLNYGGRVRAVPVERLRSKLREQGAILDGTL